MDKYGTDKQNDKYQNQKPGQNQGQNPNQKIGGERKFQAAPEREKQDQGRSTTQKDRYK